MKQSTRQLHLKEEGLNSQDHGSLARHLEAANEVWYHRYPTDWTQNEGMGGLPRIGSPDLKIETRRHIAKAV
jgi:hypothetical protein